MYFSSIVRPGSAADVWGTVLEIAGELRTSSLKHALEVVRGRHDALRVTFLERDGDVFQVLRDDRPAEPVLGTITEAHGDSPEQRRAWAETEARRVIGLPFDLASGPLWRVGVVRVAPDLHLMAVVFHHIIIDEMSAKVFADELRLAYAGPDAPALAVPAAQYSDFCLRERRDGVDQAGLDHWRDRLAGVRPARLPEDGLEDPGSVVGARLPAALPQDVAADFEVFCKERGVTPFTGMLAVYFVLLRRWSGTSDVAVGTQVFSRPSAEFFGTIGFFANTVVLRCQVTPELTFDEFLDQVSDTVHDALDHQDVPFEAVVEALAPERDADRNPLFQVAMGYGSLDPSDVWTLDGLQVTALPDPAELAGLQFDLSLDVHRVANEVGVTVEYDRRRFSADAMRQFANAFGSLLRALVSTPDVPLGSVALLDQVALDETLKLGMSDTPHVTAVDHTSAWELFERTAAATPERDAVRADGERLTFAELEDRARTMAAGLRARGVRTGTVVGICLPRRAGLIVAMLATWCAGGAFLLLDARQPEARRRVLMREAGVVLLVADEPFAGVETIAVADLAGEAAEPVHRSPAAPAYVVFTSGSTGTPKGVVVDQESLVALATTQLASMYARLPEGEQVNVGALSSLTFDVFVNQCLGMIAFGHRLLLLGDEERTDPARLLALGADADSSIGVLDCNSSQMEVLVDAGLLDIAHPPRIVVIGGESASSRLWRRLRDQPNLLAFNMFGITECTVDSARAEIGEHERQVAGRAVGTTRLYVVDDQLQLLPPTFVGEICIGGLGVAQGYAGQPAYTSEKFVADPFSGVPGARMYRTGDRGRLRPDGQLEFWGRLDDQVKVRGLRVEPGELEAALAAHPAVARAAVIATGAGTRLARLIACLVPEEQGREELTFSAVREFLRGRLPSALLPDRVEVLDTLPVTSNGKLDRRALLSLIPPDAEPEPPAQVEGTPDERQLCLLVAEALGVARVGLDDNFFELGGNSLLAMTVMSRVRTALNRELGIRAIFESSSIRDIAAQLGAPDSAPRPVLRRRGNR